jgi:hypothetical protein
VVTDTPQIRIVLTLPHVLSEAMRVKILRDRLDLEDVHTLMIKWLNEWTGVESKE